MDESPSAMPYSGLRVLDLSQGFAGPYCAALLGMQGAAVIKIEPPAGDWIRGVGGGNDGMTAWAIIANAGKRCACIDAARPEGRALLSRLARGVDVLVQNFRPGVIERLGLGYEALSAENPGLLFVSITGFGEHGRDARKPGSDSVLQAYTGMAQANRLPDGTPRRFPMLLPDTVTGIYAAQAVGAALYARAMNKRGQHLKISLLEASAAVQAPSILDDALNAGQPSAPTTVPAGIFRTRDGFMTVTSMSDAMFASLLRVVGLDDWVADPRFTTMDARQKHAGMVNEELASRLQEHTTDHWIGAFSGADVLCSPVLNYTEFRNRPQTVEARVFDAVDQPPYGPIPVPRVPGAGREWPVGPAPLKGEHTNEILREAGVDDAQCSNLAAAGVIFQAARPVPDNGDRKMNAKEAAGAAFETLKLERQADVVTLTLNRPQARNAMSLQMCRDVVEAFGTVRFDTTIRLVLIRGAGPVFCSGIDLKEMKGKPRDWVLERRNLGLDAFMAIENCPAPVVAAVHGAVVGAGCEIMAASDFTIAAEETKFQWPEVVWGAVGATQRLPRLVGLPMAKDLLFTGRVIRAPEALQLRLVSRVAPEAEFEDAIARVTEEMTRAFPLAARLVKKSMMLGRDVPIQVGVDIERQMIERTLADSEWAAGTEAFEAHLRKPPAERS